MNQEEFFAALKELVMGAIGVGEHEAVAQRTLPADREKLFFAAAELSLQYGAVHDQVLAQYTINPTPVHLN